MIRSRSRAIAWRKSTFSAGDGDCVEVAPASDAMLVRDSKNPQGPQLALPEIGWRGLLTSIR
jgi:uncharacterized protein DUF397